MKTFNWNKIPNAKVLSEQNNVWSTLARQHKHSPKAALDWAELEGLFCQAATPTQPATKGPRDSIRSDDSTAERRRREPTEINLLDGKRSLNINIFLKQFRVPNEEIMDMIKNGEHSDIGAEKLRGLLKILPESDEMEMLRSFEGDRSKLGNAEKFLIALMDVPQYKLRIEAMLLKEEFEATMDQIEPSVNAVIYAARDLLTNPHLHELLYMVLVAGNFLNSGGYAGNAAGMKLSSLQKLTDIRANKPGMTLLHYVVQQAEKKDSELLNFPDEMSCLEEATKTTMEQLTSEMNQLDSRIAKISKQLQAPSTPTDIVHQMGNFLQVASGDLASLKEGVEEVERVRLEVAEYFCEDARAFKLEECFRVMYSFCTRFRQAIAENERRRKQEEQAEIRRRTREENAVKRRSSSSQGGQPRPGSFSGSETEVSVMENLLLDIRSGFAQRKCAEMALTKNKRGKKLEVWQNGVPTSEDELSHCNSPRLSRRRMGSFSGPMTQDGQAGDNSPDVTPNGSLRRRRSRILSEEDDNKLMDYLHTAGHDGSRERKSWSGVAEGYGSLDRSFGRRMRGGGRTRPNLLVSDFGDRERPASPSPAPSNAPLDKPTGPPDQNRPSKNWRQKIESWFKENEREERQSEKLKQRLQQHRKSLDFDTTLDESGGGSGGGVVAPPSPLSTLPEDRPSDTPSTGYRRVYDDWRPSVDKTDVSRVMEAIEEAQSPQPSKEKDKSSWRKSNLNVANSSEAAATTTTTTTAATPTTTSTLTSASRRLRRLRSRSNIEPGQVVQAVQGFKEEEEDGDEDGESSRRSSLIKTLGRTDTMDTLKLYIRHPSQEDDDDDEGAGVGEAQQASGRKAQGGGASSKDATPTRSEQLLQKYRDNVDVPADVLRSIEEAEPRGSRTAQAGRRGERRSPQTPTTPGSSVRSALQQRLRDNLQPRLAGAMRSLGTEAEEDDAPRPPSVPQHLRRASREEVDGGGGDKLDKIDIDAENIETPPATRRALGGRSFRGLSSEGRRALAGEVRRGSAPRAAADSSEGEGGASEAEGRGTQRLRHLAYLARDGDSETESMLARQGRLAPPAAASPPPSPPLHDNDLGDGRFDRFSSVRKTLRHRRDPAPAQDGAAPPVAEEDSAARLRRWQQHLSEQQQQQQEAAGEAGQGSKAPDSWRDRLARRFRPGDKYDVAAAAASQQPRAPASEKLPRRNKEGLTRGGDTRSSFRGLTSTAMGGSGGGGSSDGERKRSVFGDGARGVAGKLFSQSRRGAPDAPKAAAVPSSPRASARGEPRSTLAAARSGSRSSLRSSRSSLTSANSVSTVRPARPPSRSASAGSVSGVGGGAPRSATAATRGVGLRGLSGEARGAAEDYEGTQSSPATPKGEAAPAAFPDHGRSSGSLHSSGGAATPARPLSRADSARSTGSLSKQSSEGSLRQGSLRSAARPGAAPASTSRSKRPLAPAQVRPLTAENRARSAAGSRSSAGGGAKVRRGDSGSSKENLSRSSSGNSRAPPTPAKTAAPPRPAATQRRPAGTAKKGGALPAFMRPTTASSSKGGADAPPRGKGRAATTPPPRPSIK